MQFDRMAQAVVAGYTGRDGAFATRVRFWVNQLAQRDITTLTTDDIEDCIDMLARKKRVHVHLTAQGVVRCEGDRVITASTVNRYVAALGTVFRELRRMRKLPRGFVNPMRGVSRLSEGPGRTVSVTVEDVHRLLAACRVSKNPKLAALVAMAATTGWRMGTLQALRWAQIDLKAGHADTQRTKNGTPHRTPLLPWVVDELRLIRPQQVDGAMLVFGPGNRRKAFRNALKWADLPQDWTLHHLRHVAASILAQSGASVVTIMQALNHKTPLMAMRYSHLNVDAVRESMGRAWG